MKVTLKELRARANLSQAQMAVKIGVNPATYNAWETLTKEDIAKVASLFNINPDNIAVPR